MTQGATKIYVCGTKITGSTSFSTSGGTVNYDDNTRTLTVTNVNYTKTGSSNNGISVDEVSGELTINLESTTFDIGDADAVLCKDQNHHKTTINVSGNCYLWCRSKNHAGLKLQDADVVVQGLGSLYIDHTAYGNGIKGGSGTENLTLRIKTCGIYSGNTRLHNLNKVSIVPTGNFGDDDYSTKVILNYYNSNNGYAAASNVSSWYAGTGVKILKPIASYDDDLSNLSNASFSEEVIISDESVVALLTYSYFPDENFRNYLLGLYPKGYINQSDVNARTSLTLSNKHIHALNGIHYFKKLTHLECNNNDLTSLPTLPSSIVEMDISNNRFETLTLSGYKSLKTLNISNNYNLTTLNCSSNALTSLNVQNCVDLNSLDCQSNQLASLANLPSKLQTLNCSSNNFNGTYTITDRSSLKSLNFSSNLNLTTLNCYNNALTSLNVQSCTALTTLDCHGNNLVALDNLPSHLQTLNCSSNNLINTFTMRGYDYLQKLDISSNPIKRLDCYNNALTSLNISGCVDLTVLDCHGNNLTSLGSDLPSKLQIINCSHNQLSGNVVMTGLTALKTLNINNNPKMTKLDCHLNALTSLDVQYCSAMTLLDCQKNQLTSLSLAGCLSLKDLDCSNNCLSELSLQGLNSLESLAIYANQIKEAAMGTLVNDLRTIPAGNLGDFKVQGGSGEGNVITQAQVMIARNKRWLPKKYVNNTWVDITGDVITGDVNGDGKVNVSDVSALINMIMGLTAMDQSAADVNGDGKVNVSDVSALINIILDVH